MVRGVCLSPPCLCGFSPWTPGPTHPRDVRSGEPACLCCGPRLRRGWVQGCERPWDGRKGILSSVVCALHPELWERLWAPASPNWKKRVGKSFSDLFSFIFLNCVYSSHLCPCLTF